MKRLCALMLSAWVGATQAQPDDSLMLTLHTSASRYLRGSTVTVHLVATNSGSRALSYEPAPELAGSLQGKRRTWAVSLRLAQPTTPNSIEPGRFVSIPYALTLPDNALGQVSLEVSTLAVQRLIVDIREVDKHDDSSIESLVDGIKRQEAVAPPVMSRIERTFANRFAFHEPIYFIYGPKAPGAKFQFSFKYRLMGADSKFGEVIPPFRGVYFGYTQRTLWDVDAESSPFYDTSHMPELFFEWLGPDDRKADAWFHWLGLQTGVRHESNGKDGAQSRNLNIAYLQTDLALGSLNNWHLVFSPNVFTYLAKSAENADIAHYRGYGELQLSLARNDFFRLSVATRIGSAGNKGSVQVDLTQPVRIPWIDLETYLHLQYFDGYGESLRTYNEKSSVWRVGLGFVR